MRQTEESFLLARKTRSIWLSGYFPCCFTQVFAQSTGGYCCHSQHAQLSRGLSSWIEAHYSEAIFLIEEPALNSGSKVRKSKYVWFWDTIPVCLQEHQEKQSWITVYLDYNSYSAGASCLSTQRGAYKIGISSFRDDMKWPKLANDSVPLFWWRSLSFF